MPKRVGLDIARPGVAYAAGVLILLLQLFAGAAVLDVFFQRRLLDRKRIVATKAMTQVSGHVYRVLYFGSFAAKRSMRPLRGGSASRPSACRWRARRLPAVTWPLTWPSLGPHLALTWPTGSDGRAEGQPAQGTATSQSHRGR
jgi:hypothetical protein